MRALKIILTLIIILFLLGGLALVYLSLTGGDQQEPVTVTSFEECAEHYAVMESYPRQCRTPDGKVFVEIIGNELEHQDLIQISSPRPNAEVTSPITIEGEARGQWYFEATFGLRLETQDGEVLEETFVEADGEWMTEEFVPFSRELEFSVNEPTDATLIFEKANPSGMPENAASVTMPIRLMP